MIEKMTAAPLGGVIGMVVTPMHADDDYSVNEDALRRQVDWCFAQGAVGVNATPSIGEFSHLSLAERVRCMEVTLEQIRKHHGSVLVTSSGGDDASLAGLHPHRRRNGLRLCRHHRAVLLEARRARSEASLL